MNRRNFFKNLFKLGLGGAGAVSLPKGLLDLPFETVNTAYYTENFLSDKPQWVAIDGAHIFGHPAALATTRKNYLKLSE